MKKIVPLVLSLVIVFANASFVRALEVTITDNGSGSTNEVTITQTEETVVEQNNTANVSNDVGTEVDTGENTASFNNGNKTTIETGDGTANVSVENSMNSSVVDTGECCNSDTVVTVSGNGSGSQNTVTSITSNTNTTTVNNNASLSNNVKGTVNTGNNTATSNTGNVSIKTGSITATQNIKNGPINGAHVVSSSQGGSTHILVADNGADSTTNIIYDNINNANVVINNIADIHNVVDWYLNTGNNDASWNLGDVSIMTGDIESYLNIENGPINFAFADLNIGGCCIVDDPSDPGDPDDPSKPSDPGNNGRGSNNGGGSSVGGTVASIANGVGGILGLSDTSSNTYNLWMASFMIMAAGLRLVERSNMIQSGTNEN